MKTGRRAWRVTAPAVLALVSTGHAALAVTPVQTEIQKLLADDGAAFDYFGMAVALDGDTAIVAAKQDDDNGVDSGSAYVFVRDGAGTWSLEDKLLASDGFASDAFGYQVALDGDTAVIGAPYVQGESGAAYVFVRDGWGTWSQQAKLLAIDRASLYQFGESVSIDGDTAVVGASQDDDRGVHFGSAYVFVRDGTGRWAQQAKLLSSDHAVVDSFGSSVAIAGDTAVVGASGDDDKGAYSGAAYVFVRDGAGTWSKQAKLLASDGVRHDHFGYPVAIDGETVVAGATGGDDHGIFTGAAYVFVREGTGTWSEQAKLLASDGASRDYFGESVAIEGDEAVVGAWGDDENATDSGSAYLFVRNGAGSWSERSKVLASDGAASDNLSCCVGGVGVSDGWVIAGAPHHAASGEEQGAAYLFTISGEGPRRFRVGIDNKPSNPNNPVNPFNNGRFWVAILSDESFDPLQVDVASVRFGPSNATTNSTRVRDVNHDGLPDLMLRFVIPELGVSCGMERLSLSGHTFAGDEIFGDDFIRTVGCAKRKK